MNGLQLHCNYKPNYYYYFHYYCSFELIIFFLFFRFDENNAEHQKIVAGINRTNGLPGNVPQ